jgi:hypothetical protein
MHVYTSPPSCHADEPAARVTQLPEDDHTRTGVRAWRPHVIPVDACVCGRAMCALMRA